MTRKTSDWLRDRREFCEERFSFLTQDYGYRRSLRRFRSGGFQLGYLGPGAGVLVEWYPRDGLMVWLLPMDPGETPVNWGGPGTPRGFDLGLVAAAADRQLDVNDRDTYALTEDAVTALAGQLRSCAQDMLRADYSRVPAISDMVRTRASPAPQGSPDDEP
jgi:hypothetical protein